MDANRFDAIVRSFGATTRRGALRLLVGAASGGLSALRGRGDAAAACRRVGKPCTRSGQCCTGARSKGGQCKCKRTHFTCDGTVCCLDGATCGSLLGAPVCIQGTKQLDDSCDPDLPGQCASGVCGCVVSNDPDHILCTCREADCAANGGLCEVRPDCCRGQCVAAPPACGGGDRCCTTLGEACKKDCDCCFGPVDRACRRGTCCQPEFQGCDTSGDCCGDLVCSSNECLKP